MAVLRVDHPDIRAFIHAKDDGVSAQRFNISVGVTDEFMRAVAEGGADRAARPAQRRGARQRGRARAASRSSRASAWLTGDPGPRLPRRDQPAQPHACARRRSRRRTPAARCRCCRGRRARWARSTWRASGATMTHDLDWAALRETVALGVRFLDDIVEANHFPLRGDHGGGARQPQDRPRRDGLRGPADRGRARVRLGGGARARRGGWRREIGERGGRGLARARRGARRLPELGALDLRGRGRFPERPRYRNATRTCIAPTGTIAIIAGASSGIEPLFSLAHYRRMGDGTLLAEVSEAFEQAARERGCYSDELMEALAHGARLRSATTCRADAAPPLRHRARDRAGVARAHAGGVPGAHRPRGLEDREPAPRGHAARMSRACSPLAHELGCKGVTVYRDGSRDLQVLAHGGASRGRRTPRRRRRRRAGAPPPPRRAAGGDAQVPRRRAGGLRHRRPVRGRHAGRGVHHDGQGGLDGLRADGRRGDDDLARRCSTA